MSDIKNIKNMVDTIIEGPVFEHLINGDTKSALELSFRRSTNRGVSKSENTIERLMVAMTAIGASKEELIDFVELSVGVWYASKGTVPAGEVADSLNDVELTGRVSVPSINRISSEEFDPLHHLSDHLGIDREELRELISTGSVTPNDFKGALRSAVSSLTA